MTGNSTIAQGNSKNETRARTVAPGLAPGVPGPLLAGLVKSIKISPPEGLQAWSGTLLFGHRRRTGSPSVPRTA